MGSGSTVAAAEAYGVCCIERHTEYYEMSRTAIPKLAALNTQFDLKTPKVLIPWCAVVD